MTRIEPLLVGKVEFLAKRYVTFTEFFRNSIKCQTTYLNLNSFGSGVDVAWGDIKRNRQ